MSRLAVLREAAVVFVGTSAAIAGLVALTPAPWTIALWLSLFAGALALITDVLLRGWPHPMQTPQGQTLIVAGSTIALVSALSASFSIGRNTQPSPDEFLFIVTPQNLTTIAKVAPVEEALDT